MAAVAALGLAGCASTPVQTEASAYVTEHHAAATRAASATKTVELEASGVSSATHRSLLQRLARSAARDRRDVVQVGEWSAAGGVAEGAEEEDLPRAESQVTEAADELAGAMAALETYTRAPSASALARYQTKLMQGRELWDEAVVELWHLAHEANPPTV
jgi:type IV pilus biogenesis protein CpaD/CtpE